MGDFETIALAMVESSLKYHPDLIGFLTRSYESRRGTVIGGQFDWGGLLPKSNGGVQRYTQHGQQSCIERKGISVLNCETYKSSRYESRT